VVESDKGNALNFSEGFETFLIGKYNHKCGWNSRHHSEIILGDFPKKYF